MELQSETTATLTAALVAAQARIEGAARDAKNAHLGNTYADLSSIWEACRGPLTENGFAVSSAIEETERGLLLRTTLRHTSGEWLASVFPIAADPAKPQAIGSAITYGRRYTLAALVGVCPADDDGEAAMPERRERSEKRRGRDPDEGRREVNRQFPRPAAGGSAGEVSGATAWSQVLDRALARWDRFEPIEGKLVPSASDNQAKGRDQVAREHRIAHELASAAVKDEKLAEADLLKAAEAGKEPARDPAKVWANVKRLFVKDREWTLRAIKLYLDDKEAEAVSSPGSGAEAPQQGDEVRNGKALFAWLKQLEEKHEVGLLKYIHGWGKLQDFPVRMVDWDREMIDSACKEAIRKLEAIGAAQTGAMEEALSS